MSQGLELLRTLPSVRIRQRFEVGELFGFETRNKYAVETDEGQPIAYAAEQQKGIFGFLFRQFLGHWRSFDLHFFDADRTPMLIARHPFCWIFQRMEVFRPDGEKIGSLQQRFSILSKKFDVLDARGGHLMQVHSPIWRIWTFPFMKHGREAARIEKKWSGVLTEVFTDKDNFHVYFQSTDLSLEERMLLVAAGIFIDLKYFEVKPRN